MSIRLIDLDKDYNSLATWWEARGWPVLPKHSLPQTGYICNDICAAFIYKTDSTICFLEWIISDPKSDKDFRDESLDLLIKHCEMSAKEMNFKSIFTLTPNPTFGDRLENKHSFMVADKNSTTYVRSI